MKTGFQCKSAKARRKPRERSHDWNKRTAEIKAELDAIDREIALHSKPEPVNPKHD